MIEKNAGCGRAEELVAYLYGELAGEGARLFRLHLDACDACREELSALGGVREAVGAWRAEALGSIPPLNVGEALAPAARTPRAPAQRRSASAALREFFSLSPLWLRAGAAAAVLAVCALTALTLARAEVRWDGGRIAFRTGVSERIVKGQAPPQAGYTDEQVEAIVARKVEEARARFAAEAAAAADAPRREQIVNASEKRAENTNKTEKAHAPRRTRAPRRADQTGDSLLAEENLPRLSDLLNGSY